MVSYLHDTRLHSLLIHFVSLCSNVTQFSLRPSLFIVFKIATHPVTYISSAFLPRYISPQHFLPSNALYNLLLWGVWFFFHTLCSPTTSPHLPNVSYTWAGIFICFLHWCVPGAGTELTHSRCWINTLKEQTVINSSGTESHPFNKNVITSFQKEITYPLEDQDFKLPRKDCFSKCVNYIRSFICYWK